MAEVFEVAHDQFRWSAEGGPAADVRRIAASATAHDGTGPLNEAALLALTHRGLDGARLWLAAAGPDSEADSDPDSDATPAGFALLRGDELDLAVSPDARWMGLGRALAEAVAAHLSAAPALTPTPTATPTPTPTALEAWSHAAHPGADALARRYGLTRSRELVVMRRPGTPPLEEPELPEPDECV